MLDFLLVLGQVPGTNFEITFSELASGLLVAGFLYLRFRRPQTLKDWRTRIYLQYLKSRYLYFRSRIMY